MPIPARRPLVFAALIALLVVVRVRSEDRADDPDRAAEAIRAVLDTQVACWNRGDLDGFAATYRDAPDLVFQSGGERQVGWGAMRERYRARYEAEGRAAGRLRFSELEVRVLAPGAGYAYGRWRLEMSDGSEPEGLFTVLLRELPEGWRIVHDHTSTAAP